MLNGYGLRAPAIYTLIFLSILVFGGEDGYAQLLASEPKTGVESEPFAQNFRKYWALIRKEQDEEAKWCLFKKLFMMERTFAFTSDAGFEYRLKKYLVVHLSACEYIVDNYPAVFSKLAWNKDELGDLALYIEQHDKGTYNLHLGKEVLEYESRVAARTITEITGHKITTFQDYQAYMQKRDEKLDIVWKGVKIAKTDQEKWSVIERDYPVFRSIAGKQVWLIKQLKSDLIVSENLSTHLLELYPAIFAKFEFSAEDTGEVSAQLPEEKKDKDPSAEESRNLDSLSPQTARKILLLITGEDFSSRRAYFEYIKKRGEEKSSTNQKVLDQSQEAPATKPKSGVSE